MAYKGANIGYWLTNRLEQGTVRVLKRIMENRQRFDRDKFEVASLISMDCVEADLHTCTLSITDKGRDALEFFEVKG